MAKTTLKMVTDQLVNEYLNKRFKTKTLDEQDPLRMVVNDMLTRVMRGIVRDIARSNLKNTAYDYLIEA